MKQLKKTLSIIKPNAQSSTMMERKHTAQLRFKSSLKAGGLKQ